MNKKIIIASLMLVVLLLILNNRIYNVKIEYEKLNSKKDYIKVNITKDNPFQNISINELKKQMKQTSVIFIGSATNQSSRSSINILSKAAQNTGINKIYYIDINKIKNKKIIKKYKIDNATLLVFKNGKLDNNINNSKNKIKKNELIKKYEEAINRTLICNPLGNTC